MRILYGVPTTGYGHVIRSKTVIEGIKKYWASPGEESPVIDVLVSGESYGMERYLDRVKYVKKGVTTSIGNIDTNKQIDFWIKSLKNNSIPFMFSEARDPNLKNYDLIISDSEPVSILAAKLNKIKSVGVSNLYSLENPELAKMTYLPWLVVFSGKLFGKAKKNIGFFYDEIGENILTPIFTEQILNLKNQTKDLGHITVYLGTIPLDLIVEKLLKLPDFKFHVFHPSIKKEYENANISFKVNDPQVFSQDLASCHGLITAAGFTTTTEAIYLGKKMLIIPVTHFEQRLNANYLKKMGVKILENFNNITDEFDDWENNFVAIKRDYPDIMPKLIGMIKNYYILK